MGKAKGGRRRRWELTYREANTLRIHLPRSWEHASQLGQIDRTSNIPAKVTSPLSRAKSSGALLGLRAHRWPTARGVRKEGARL